MEEFKETIDELNNLGYRTPYIELALSLEFGRINKILKNETEILPEEIALFRILRMCPSIIDIAANKFEVM